MLKLILKLSKYIQPISHSTPHERINTFLMKKETTNNSHSNLTDGNAGFTRLELMSCGYCIKPETSEMLRKRFCTIVKSAKFFHVSRGPSHYWAVLKNRYFRP